MNSNLLRGLGLAACMTLVGFSAQAQDTTTNRVATNTDWSVFEEDNPRECWAVSAPKDSSLVDRNGNPTEGRRGEILLMVFNRPGSNVVEQVVFTGGYPFAGGSTVTLSIGDSNFELYTDGEWAWPATPDADAQIVAAMKRGANAVARGRSGRGNQTIDSFSLLGFTAATEDAARRCAG
ncbi:invasion associated locus B family protein [Aestuariibius sp. HNIBRBA575]|uniref:invasion associated locus B family protein n=1 Tax=Aestuariibius sp. HNIBRBA575 TaxID=3233343 RepID=UPI0034A48DD6